MEFDDGQYILTCTTMCMSHEMAQLDRMRTCCIADTGPRAAIELAARVVHTPSLTRGDEYVD